MLMVPKASITVLPANVVVGTGQRIRFLLWFLFVNVVSGPLMFLSVGRNRIEKPQLGF